jgi:hypothetical protein
MALFGEKCARCGIKTRHKKDDKPTCEACEQEMQLLVEAEGEQSRPCPVDGESMKKEVAHMLIIDRCPRCHGVWLDAGELERIKGGVEASALMAMTSGFTVPLG